METNVITGEIMSGAMKVHTALGPGLLESIYRKCLGYELRKRGLRVVEEKPIQVFYDGVEMGTGLRLDLLVEEPGNRRSKGSGKDDSAVYVATSISLAGDQHENRPSDQLQR